MQQDELIYRLEIPQRATIIITKMSFLLRSDSDRQKMFTFCNDNPGSEYVFLAEKRKQLIDEEGYKDKNEFISDYNDNNIKALEKLCQEKVDGFKLARLKVTDPETLYSLYEKNKYSNLLHLALS
ncbi:MULTISPECIES: hypothetical protein [Paenibacillus]|uniref:Uncharacterized protein n=2 Tax=Paenibacillus TaxID=44249 RepID=A0ABX2ZA57_PAEPO|nr:MULTISPECIES: hypothetical protein [Paenibacillus]KAF6630566.1 hypothetical protein H6F38_14140 [Paenibacillus sp. EKM208P]MDR6779438.1 hypothetical protein [Paenibacillus peoriae]ODA08205.1 hypothetical protein A7312_27975 [Paenibacillus polymyxa]